MRVIVAILALLAILAGAAMATRPGEGDFDAMLKQAVERKIATTDIGAESDDPIATIALVGCKLRPSDCVKLLREALDVTVEKQAFYTRFTVKGLSRETTCTGAFTRIWCERPVLEE